MVLGPFYFQVVAYSNTTYASDNTQSSFKLSCFWNIKKLESVDMAEFLRAPFLSISTKNIESIAPSSYVAALFVPLVQIEI